MGDTVEPFPASKAKPLNDPSRFAPCDHGRYRLQSPLNWRIGGPLVEHLAIIPAGFTFDSSVPVALRWLLSPHDPRFLLAACVHDWLLERGYGRAQAAAEWHDGARAGGAPYGLARWAYVAVAFWAVFAPVRNL
jgi:hypothetical protein